jgi:hypothetical protein
MMAKTKTKSRKSNPDARMRRLQEVVRLGQLFIEGDMIDQLLTEYGYTWTDPDNIDYNHEPFIAMKKVVMRLERTPVDGGDAFVNIWRRRPDDKTKAEPLLAGMRLSPIGRGIIEMTKPIRDALVAGKQGVDRRDDGTISIFAPIRDSMDRIAGAIEVFDART